MRKAILVLGGMLIAVGAFVWAQQTTVPASQVAIGGKLADLQLVTLAGQPTSLHKYAGEKGTLVIFVSTRCPISNDYNQRMAELARDYTARGFAVVGVNSNRNEPADEVAVHARDRELGFTILKDPENRIADYLGASFTPEAYVFDTSWTLRYHGRIDDSRNAAKISTRDLRAALDAVAGGQPVVVAKTKAFGCTIKRIPRS